MEGQKNKLANPKIVINKDMIDHGNDPFFKKKAEASKKVIEKHGLPKSFFVEKK